MDFYRFHTGNSEVFLVNSNQVIKGENMSNYTVAQMDEIDPVQCPCGQSRRAFVSDDNPVGTLHITDIEADARVHFHKKLTEIYLVLEGEGTMELDGNIIKVKPMTSVFIKPGCRHRAVGPIRAAIVPIPAFDPEDEWFDD